MEQEKNLSIDIAPKNLDPISFFDKDAGFVFAYKKTEKLVSAIYMITGLFSDNEPMKWNLRRKASDLLSLMINYKDLNESEFFEFTYNVKTRVLELVSLLEVSLRGGLISEMNFSILNQEFTGLLDGFDRGDTLTKNSSSHGIPKNFFDMTETIGSLSQRESARGSAGLTSGIYRTSSGFIKDKNFADSREGFKRSNRQNIILGLLKKKKELTIKDIAAVIKDCSEKTIQRELNSFILAGVLKRVGERRWSKYSLADNVA